MLDNDFETIYDAYYQDVYLYLMKLTNGRKDLVEELTQETFYQVFISLHRFKGKSKLKTWIIEIAKHTCFNYYKKNPYTSQEEVLEKELEHDALHSEPLEEYLIRNEQKESLRKSILGLEKKYRDVVIYRIYYDLSFQKVARLMGISENSAKVLFYRAKSMLKTGMEE